MEYEWQSMDAGQFNRYLNDNLQEYGISEAKLARILGIPQKSINRYRNNHYPEDPKRVKKIWEYFHQLEEEKAGNEKKDENEIIGFDENGEPVFIAQDGDNPYPEESIPAGCEKLKFFTPDAQKFIVDHYWMIGAITPDEIEYIKCMKQCKSADRIREYMESLNEDIHLYMKEDLGPDCIESTEPQYDYFSKVRDYQWMVYNFDKFPTSWSNSVNSKTGEIRGVYRKEPSLKFADLNWQVFAAGGFFDGYDVIDNATAIKGYLQKDWYYLYLYAKTSLYDANCETIKEVNYKNRWMGWNLLKVWKMLEA